MHNKFDAAIRSRLAERKGYWLEIAERAGVSHSWMSKFMNGHINNPGIRTLEKLDKALKSRAQPATSTKEIGSD